jgi:hypothetical protein
MVIGADPEKQLQPFHEYECTGIEDEHVVFVPAEENIEEEFENHKEDYESLDEFASDYYGYHKNEEGLWGRKTNPNAKWDWYQLGGRWSGSIIRLKPDSNRIGVGVGRPGVFGNKVGIDSALFGDIDFEAKRVEAEVAARVRYCEVLDVFKGVLPVLDYKWEDLSDEENPLYNGMSWDEKRTLYHNQPAILEVNKHSDVLGHFFEIKDFQCTEDEFVAKARKNACSTFAVIKNGKWYEKGEMGWWASVSNEKEGEDWSKEVEDLLADVSDDTLISIYDCHI